MTLAPSQVALLAVLVVIVGVIVALVLERRVGWRGAGGVALIAATPLAPHAEIALGLSLDDVLPLLGLVFLVRALPRFRGIPRFSRSSTRPPPSPTLRILVVGTAILLVAGVLSAVANAASPFELLSLALHGAGRTLFLIAIVAGVALVSRTPDARRFAARALALVGVIETVFGLVAYLVPLPYGIGLERARPTTVLAGEIPGRLAGTLGISPNFTGAIFIATILLTAGLAAEARGPRARAIGWTAVALQLVALTLTYSRVSLVVTIAGLVVLIALRRLRILLIPIGAILAVVAIATPIVGRFMGDSNDRLALWTSAFRLMVDHPLFGVGPGRMLAAAQLDPARYIQTPFGSAVSTAHNTILLAGAETGIPGAIGALLVYIGLGLLVFRAFRLARRGRDSSLLLAAALALSGILIQAMVNNLFTVGVTSVITAYLIGSQLLFVGDPTAEPGRG